MNRRQNPPDPDSNGQRLCGARKKGGGTCKRPLRPGQVKCRYHGGNAPQVLNAERERVVVMRIGEELTKANIEFSDPLEGLLREVSRSASTVLVYEGLVMKLRDPMEPPELDDEGRPTSAPIYGRNHMGDATPHVLIEMWDKERDRHARYCKMALDAGVAEREVRLAEQQGQLIAKVVLSTIDDPRLQLPADTRRDAREIAAEHLRLVSGDD